EQEALEQRVQELCKAVEEIARAAQAAGINDSAFQERLREVQQLLQRAVTPELEQRLRELQEALAKLDPDATRQALQRLAEAQQQLKAELERSRELFQRAATEGALASLAADAEDLKRRQAEWNETDARRPDSAAGAARLARGRVAPGDARRARPRAVGDGGAGGPRAAGGRSAAPRGGWARDAVAPGVDRGGDDGGGAADPRGGGEACARLAAARGRARLCGAPDGGGARAAGAGGSKHRRGRGAGATSRGC